MVAIAAMVVEKAADIAINPSKQSFEQQQQDIKFKTPGHFFQIVQAFSMTTYI